MLFSSLVMVFPYVSLFVYGIFFFIERPDTSVKSEINLQIYTPVNFNM